MFFIITCDAFFLLMCLKLPVTYTMFERHNFQFFVFIAGQMLHDDLKSFNVAMINKQSSFIGDKHGNIYFIADT